MKRISFTKEQAYMLYEWYQAIATVSPFNCMCCPPIARRLGKFIGQEETKNVIKNVKQNPYVSKLIK